MLQIERFRVSGLFGYMEHEINFRVGAPTILTGPNGAGKTHVLRLLEYALGLDLQGLMEMPFGSLSMRFNDGQELNIQRDTDRQQEVTVLQLSVTQLGLRRGEPFRIA